MSKKRHVTLPPLRKDENGNPLCRWCRGPLQPPRRSWCSDKCVQEYLLLSSPQAIRRAIFERDRGICAICGVATMAWKRAYEDELERLYGILRSKMILAQEERKALWDEVGRVHDRMKYLRKYLGSHCWEAHHIIAVVEGGGECGLEGYQTLCLSCHKGQTKELRARLKKNKVSPREKQS